MRVDGDLAQQAVFRREVLAEDALELLRADASPIALQLLEAPLRRVGELRRFLELAHGEMAQQLLGGASRAGARGVDHAIAHDLPRRDLDCALARLRDCAQHEQQEYEAPPPLRRRHVLFAGCGTRRAAPRASRAWPRRSSP